MQLLVNSAVLTVAVLHIGFMALEMFLWNKAAGLKIHRFKPEFADKTRTLAANQGLYNGFLAAGLIWSLLNEQLALDLQVFFLACVITAGVFGGATASRLILWVQALPGIIALLLVFLAQSTY
jgi:putative membrane protein